MEGLCSRVCTQTKPYEKGKEGITASETNAGI